MKRAWWRHDMNCSYNINYILAELVLSRKIELESLKCVNTDSILSHLIELKSEQTDKNNVWDCLYGKRASQNVLMFRVITWHSAGSGRHNADVLSLNSNKMNNGKQIFFINRWVHYMAQELYAKSWGDFDVVCCGVTIGGVDWEKRLASAYVGQSELGKYYDKSYDGKVKFTNSIIINYIRSTTRIDSKGKTRGTPYHLVKTDVSGGFSLPNIGDCKLSSLNKHVPVRKLNNGHKYRTLIITPESALELINWYNSFPNTDPVIIRETITKSSYGDSPKPNSLNNLKLKIGDVFFKYNHAAKQLTAQLTTN